MLDRVRILVVLVLAAGATPRAEALDIDFAAVGLEAVTAGPGLVNLVPKVGVRLGTSAGDPQPLEYQVFVDGAPVGGNTSLVTLSQLCTGPGCSGDCRVTVGDQINDGVCLVLFKDCDCIVSVAPLAAVGPVHIPPGAECKLVLDPNNLVSEIDETNNSLVIGGDHAVPALSTWSLILLILMLLVLGSGAIRIRHRKRA